MGVFGGTDLVLQLLTELQGYGEEHQRVTQPRHHTLNFVNMAHLKPVVVELTVLAKCKDTVLNTVHHVHFSTTVSYQ